MFVNLYKFEEFQQQAFEVTVSPQGGVNANGLDCEKTT